MKSDNVKNRIIRKTRSLCPECLRDLPADISVSDGGVYMLKKCPECGDFAVRLSKNASYYEKLDKYFFSVMNGKFKQRDYLVRLTGKCNLDCPICLASANEKNEKDLNIDDLLGFARKKKRLKFDLMSAEPTLRKDLPEIIRKLKKKGHIAALHTNGIKLADLDYLATLRKAGLDEVHLQFDGFEDETYIALRGRPLSVIKAQALENLETLNIATDLVMVVKPGLNEHEIPSVLEYAKKHSFVRELFFLGFRSLGKAREAKHDECYTPDDLIDIVEKKTCGEIDRQSVGKFQKLYFAILSILKVPKCLYIQHYLLMRDRKGGFVKARDFCDWDKLEKHLDKLPSIPDKFSYRLIWFFGLCFKMFSINTVKSALDLLKMKIWSGFDLSKTAGKTLIIGFITACDPFIYDEMIATFCGKGEIATDLWINESGADANIGRERLWKSIEGQNNSK